MPDQLLTRAFEVRSADLDERTVTGIAVPWETPVKIRDWWIGETYFEQIARGAVVESDDAKLYAEHATIIGRVISHRDTDEGWEITARISETARGNDVYALLRDGALDRFSIGFEALEHVESRDDDDVLTVTRTKIRVREVSVVPFPAYDTAKVSSVRSATTTYKENTPMTESTLPAADVALRESVDDLARQVELIRAEGIRAAGETGPQFRSFGDYVKAVASGDEAALRAYTGAVSGDAILKDAWVGDLTRILGGKQPVKNAFSTGPLPATGLTVEYAKLKSDTTQVTKQATEGADLAFGKVAIEVAKADVETFGGYSSLSRQTIERADVGILDTTFTALAVKYAKAIETKVRSVVTTAYNATAAAALDSVSLPATGDTDVKWITALLDVAEKFDDNDRTFEGLFVSKSVFLALATAEAKDRLLKVSGGALGSDGIGTINLPGINGEIASLPVRVFPGWTGDKALAYDSFAVKTLESLGAPLRLQDENVVNLTKDFSVYGYGASFVQAADGLVKIVPAAG